MKQFGFLVTLLSVIFNATLSGAQDAILPTAAKDRLDGLSRHRELRKESWFMNVPFRNIGPTIMSGRVTDIEVNPENPAEFYVAYASGGLWHTVSNGQSFIPLFDYEDAMTMGNIAVNWKTRDIWVGTGEVNSSRSSYSGTGVYLSSDSGKTWTNTGLHESHHIGKILLHPGNPDVAWVAVMGHLYSPNPERGVYKTIDKGRSWQHVLQFDENTGAVSMDLDPSNPDVIYASAWHRERRAWNFVEGGKSGGIFKSTDGGSSWTKLTVEGSGFHAGEGTGRIGIAVHPLSSNIIYAVLDNQNKRNIEDKKDTSMLDVSDIKKMSKSEFLNVPEKKLSAFIKSKGFPEKYSAEKIKELIKTDSIKVKDVLNYLNDANNSLFDTPVIGAEIYKSSDGGKTWNKTHDTYLKNLFYTYGYYFGKIYTAASDTNTVVVCGVPLILSSDGGKSFVTIDGDNTHGDHHAVWINPKNKNHMIIGNDGGVNITYDSGRNWFKANTPPVGQFYSLAVDMDEPYNVYGGLQDNGVWTGSSANENEVSWHQYGQYPYRHIMGGDGMQVQVDYRDNKTVYTGFQFGNYYRLDKNKVHSAESIKPENDIGEENYRFNWQSPIHLSRHNQDILYFGSNKFHRSMNKGKNMLTLSNDLTNNDKTGDVPFNTITCIAESPMRFGLVYVGTDDGLAWISRDAGYTWSAISDSLPDALYVSRIVPSSHYIGRVYLSMNGYRNDHFNAYLFVSDNNGESWQSIADGLPPEPINVICEDPANEYILFVGTDNGLYCSLNRGKKWMSMNGKIPRAPVHDLIIHPREADLIVATHGRSIYIAPLREIRALHDSVIESGFSVLGISAPPFSKRWGSARNVFADPVIPQSSLEYFTTEPGECKIRILSHKKLELANLQDTAEAGINYTSVPLRIENKVLTAFNRHAEVKAIAADDGNFYLTPGKYILEITSLSGVKREKQFEIRKRDE
ncbi:MAG: glycosyl hydrolase [Bacteroidetes bacterium]|nr:MAG: glycosyl hydrolase [Bacteroidota bacterium]REK06530.1 MAG: glycosyl hydrolase [Bacteroidota bacterium]REK33296.1 MAG: glycosyl hydrolase [Bacteroidota bacterium]REK49696.1 MAG: glycosyl hydrolase [Bacteroidota bacterium]